MTRALVLALLLLLGAANAGRAAEPELDALRPVDLNQATLAELEQLPGIGPRKAEAIVELRKKRPFTRVTQLLEVKGVGRKTLERLRPWVRVAGPAPPSPLPVQAAPVQAAPAE